ncbi:hypothetical protein [Streptacidiphilus sp. P02-A3a]|uniref:hypothetical protein n=1 Tax=Streptacidiphilus sp. P02-A3a TaxID=2704468 RepID=UPI0015FC7472|nr:hypothetical protein [Streptacidiphilus sp. P02-A3a]QMU69957.1 hypothetical protein GXP74_18740 [Streptacidiphilus sp. P02-A3a]
MSEQRGTDAGELWLARVRDGRPANGPAGEVESALRRGGAELHERWLLGLRRNPALSAGALRRLLPVELPSDAVDFWLTQRDLRPGTTEAVMARGNVRQRRQLLENPNADSAALAAMVHDPDPRVRRGYVALSGDWGRQIPAETRLLLAADPDARVRALTARYLDLPVLTRARLAADPDPQVRQAAVGRATWARLPPGVRDALRDDADPGVRAAVEEASRIEQPLPCRVPQYLAATRERRLRAASEAPLDRELAELLAEDEDPAIRRALAANPHAPTELALRLSEDPDDGVRLTLSQREELTEEQRAAIAYIVPNGHTWPPRWIRERGHEPAVARRAAASAHVLLRRGIAMARQLPPDVVRLLADDEDFFVRLTLCESCPDAPHELVIEMYAHWHGLRWGMLLGHPNFARPGLARFADHANDRLRHAALYDPDGGPELVLRLADDPYVAPWAVSDPRLPGAELVRRLGDPRHARAAAANPALPTGATHRLLDLAGIPADPG